MIDDSFVQRFSIVRDPEDTGFGECITDSISSSGYWEDNGNILSTPHHTTWSVIRYSSASSMWGVFRVQAREFCTKPLTDSGHETMVYNGGVQWTLNEKASTEIGFSSLCPLGPLDCAPCYLRWWELALVIVQCT